MKYFAIFLGSLISYEVLDVLLNLKFDNLDIAICSMLIISIGIQDIREAIKEK